MIGEVARLGQPLLPSAADRPAMPLARNGAWIAWSALCYAWGWLPKCSTGVAPNHVLLMSCCPLVAVPILAQHCILPLPVWSP